MPTKRLVINPILFMIGAFSFALSVCGCVGQEGGEDVCSGGTLSGPTAAYGSFIAPYVDASDILAIPEAYATDAAKAPWGFIHVGVDLIAAGDHIPFQAVTDGTIRVCPPALTTSPSGGTTGVYQIPYYLVSGGTAVLYNMEMFSSDESDVQQQMAYLVAQDGQTVKQGDLLFYFHKGNTGSGGAHVHYGVDNGTTSQTPGAVCPQPYFTSAALASILGILRDGPNGHPSWNLCY